MNHHKSRLNCHRFALILESFGTIFILFDTWRINKIAEIVGYFSYNGEPPEFHRWYYHSAFLGFTLLFAGIFLAGIALYLEYRTLAEHQSSISSSVAPKIEQRHSKSLSPTATMGPDLLFQLVLKLAKSETDSTDGLIKRGITLNVGGLLVSGYIASGRDFAMHYSLTDFILEKVDSPDSKRPPEDGEASPDYLPEFIHLSDAHYFSPGGLPIPGEDKGVFWRGRLSDVSGFHFGILKLSNGGNHGA